MQTRPIRQQVPRGTVKKGVSLLTPATGRSAWPSLHFNCSGSWMQGDCSCLREEMHFSWIFGLTYGRSHPVEEITFSCCKRIVDVGGLCWLAWQNGKQMGSLWLKGHLCCVTEQAAVGCSEKHSDRHRLKRHLSTVIKCLLPQLHKETGWRQRHLGTQPWPREKESKCQQQKNWRWAIVIQNIWACALVPPGHRSS